MNLGPVQWEIPFFPQNVGNILHTLGHLTLVEKCTNTFPKQ